MCPIGKLSLTGQKVRNCAISQQGSLVLLNEKETKKNKYAQHKNYISEQISKSVSVDSNYNI